MFIKPSKSLDAKERKLFNEIVKSFDSTFFAAADGMLLEQFVRCYFRAEINQKLLDEEGEIVTGQRGNQVKNPRVAVVNSYRSMMASMSTKLRLTVQQRLIPQNVTPSRNRARNNRVYQPDNASGKNWRDFKNKDLDS